MNNTNDSTNPTQQQAGAEDKKIVLEKEKHKKRIEELQEQSKKLLQLYQRELPEVSLSDADMLYRLGNKRDALRYKKDNDCETLKKNANDLVASRNEFWKLASAPIENCLEAMEQIKALLAERENVYSAQIGVMKDRIALASAQKTLEDELDKQEKEFNDLPDSGSADGLEKRRAILAKVRALAERESVVFDFYGFEDGLKKVRGLVEHGVRTRVWGLRQKLADVPADQKSLFEDFLNDTGIDERLGENAALKTLESQLLASKSELDNETAALASEPGGAVEAVLMRPGVSAPARPTERSGPILTLPFSMEEYPFMLNRRLTRLGLDVIWMEIQRVSREEPRQEADLNRLQKGYKDLLDNAKAEVERLKTRFDESISVIEAVNGHVASYAGPSAVKTDSPDLLRALSVLGLMSLQEKDELTEEDMRLVKEKAMTLRSQAHDVKQALHRDEGEMELWRNRLLSTYSEAQLEQWRLNAVKSQIETSQESSKDGLFADHALQRIEIRLNDIVWWKKYQPHKGNSYGVIKDQLEKVRDDFDKWKRAHEWMQLELELQRSRREKNQMPQAQLAENLKELSSTFAEQRAAREASSEGPGHQSAAPPPEWLGRVVSKVGKKFADSMELRASLPEEQVEQQLSAIFEKMKEIFKNPGEERSFDHLQELQNQALQLTSERPWQRDIADLSSEVGELLDRDPLRERAFDQRVIAEALYRSTWQKFMLIVYKNAHWLQEKSTLTAAAWERVSTAQLSLSHMPPKQRDLMEYVLELEKPHKWSKEKIKEFIGNYMDYMKNESVETIRAVEVIYESPDRQGAMVRPEPNLRETARRVGDQLADPFFTAMSQKRTQDQINIDLASLNDNEFRRLEDLPPMLKWAVPRLLEAKKKQMVSLKELEQRVSAQIKLVGRELIKWQSESYPLKKAAVPLLARTLEDTIRAFEEQANAPAPADVAYLRDEQAEMVDCARRAHGWNALEPTLDRAGSWLNFYDSELQRLQNRIKEDNKQAEAAPLKNEFERRLDSAEDNLRYALEQEDLQDFERVLAAYEFIKRLLMNTLKSNLNNFESGLEDAGDTNVTPVKTELSKIRKFMEYPWLDTPQQVVDALTKTIDELIKVGNQQEAPLKDQLQKLTGELNVFVENWTLMVVTPFNHFNGVLAIGQNRQTQQSIDRRIPGAFLSRVRESFKELKREEKKYEQTRADKRESTWRDELDDRESDIRERLITEMRREAAREVATENKRNDIQSRLLGVIRTQARQDFRAKDYLSDEEETRITDQLNSLNEARRALGLPEIDFPENKKRVAEQLQFLSVSLRDIFPDLSKDDTTPLAKLLRAARDGLNNLEKTIGAKERYSFEDEEAYVEEQVKASEIRVKNEANEEIDTAEGRRAIESVVSEKLRNYESSYRGAGPYERSAVEACEEIARYAEHELRRVESWESYGYEFPLLRERAKHLQRGVRELRKESAGDLLTHLVDRKLPNLDTKLLKLTRAASIGKEVVQSLESEFTAIQLELESDPDLPKLETSAAALKLIEFFDRAIQLNNKIDELVSRHQANIRDRMQDIWDLIKERTEQVKAQKAAESDEDKAEIQKKIKRIELSLNAQLKIVKGWRWGRQEAAVVTRAFGKDKAPALTMRSSAIRKGNLDNEYQSIVGTLNSDKHRRALMAGAIPQSLTIEKLTQWQGELEIMEKKKQELGERIGKLNAQVDLENDIGTLESAAAIFKDIWQSHPDLEAPLSERSSAPVSAEEMLRSVERWSNALTKQKEKFLQIPVDVKDEKPLEEIKATLDLIREAIEKKLKDPEFQKAKKNYLMKQNQRVEARQERLNSVQKMMDSLSSLGSYLSMAYGYEEQTQRSAANHKYFLSSSEPGDNVTTFLNWGHHPLAPDAYRILSGEQQNDGLARLEAAVEPVSYAMQAYQELQPAPGGELFLGSEFKNRSFLGKASRYLRQSSLAAMGSSAATSSKVPEGAVRVMEEKEGKLVPGEEIRRDIRPKPEMNEANKAMWDWLKGAGLSVATKFYWAPNEFTDGAGLNIPQNTCIDYIPGDKPGEPEASFIVRDPDPRIDQALRVPADWVPKDERESLIKKIDNLKKAVEISRNNGSGISPGEIKQPYQVAHKTIACLRAEELQKVETKDQVKGRGPSRK